MNSITIQVDIIAGRNIARWQLKGLDGRETTRMVGNVPFIDGDAPENALGLAAHHAAIALQSHLIRRHMEEVKKQENWLSDQQRKAYGAALFTRIVKGDQWTHDDIASIAMAPDDIRLDALREASTKARE